MREGVGSRPARTFQGVGSPPEVVRDVRWAPFTHAGKQIKKGVIKVDRGRRGWHNLNTPPHPHPPCLSQRCSSAVAWETTLSFFFQFWHFLHSSLRGFLTVRSEVVPLLPPCPTGAWSSRSIQLDGSDQTSVVTGNH